jgi:CTP synthase
MPKYIFVTGGVVSSLGKGLTSASIGLLLEEQGLNVAIQKVDPYLNVDPGTMNPFQHGEVYVTDDGAETDLDLGHYERFTSQTFSKLNSITAGSIYESVIKKERRGDFLGATVQVIPHVTNEIKDRIKALAENKDIDVVITELGGTVGDIEGLPFLEAVRQFGLDNGKENVLYIHLTLIPYLSFAQELKTKPTQHSVGRLREIGIQPDILICRTEKSLNQEIKDKIALFCNVEASSVIEEKNVDDSIYEVPCLLKKENLDKIILDKLGIEAKEKNQDLIYKWDKLIDTIKNPKLECRIGVIGKYVALQDAYKSIYEALYHAGFANNTKVEIIKINAEELKKDNIKDKLKELNGILVPGGFGYRGIEEKIDAIRYARENNIPFFGICLGLQCAVIEFARNVLGYETANSSEFDENTEYPVIDLMLEQNDKEDKGGTMRLGAYPCEVKENTKTCEIYSEDEVLERHRHRYEFNNKYRNEFEEKGLIVSGAYKEKDLVEIVELKDHPFFIAVQFHPEFKSKPIKPHPLFNGFIKAVLNK